jgi:hypothetical protein
VFKIRNQIEGSELILNIAGDFHYGVNGVSKDYLETELNTIATQHNGNIFRIFTGDLIENQLKTSVGHNYDAELADPSVQKTHMIDVLTNTNKTLYGESKLNNLKTINKKKDNIYNNVLSVSVDGNHEYRTRKVAAQWLTKEMCEQSKTLYLGIQAIVDLTIYNKRLDMERTFKIYVAHRPSKTDAGSPEAILRAFRKKQSSFPGVDIFIFGHFHKMFLHANGYFDIKSRKFKKVLYAINPSPVCESEYAEEAGYVPIKSATYQNLFLPLNPNLEIYGII